MKSNSRTKNSILNIVSSIFFQFFKLLANFILRTIFIKQLSTEFLGLNGLFTNVLSVLSLAELGIGSAIVYSMYKPLSEKDEKKLSGLINYYKKLYSIIGLIVLLLGLALVPFLKYIININEQIDNITLYYLMFLLNSVTSYFLIYKTSIVTADQKEYVLKKIDIFFTFLTLILQIIMLLIFKNYFVYLLVQIILSILQNYVKSKKSEKMYPLIKRKENIDKNEKKNIWVNISSLFMYQIGSVSLNYTDNLLISILVGTVMVGYYSNYLMIFSSLSSFISYIFMSMVSSIGNYNVSSSDAQKKKIYDVLDMLSFWIYGVCSLCLLFLTQDFISLWIGKDFLLSNNTLFVIIINFYIAGILYPNLCFRTTTNLFKQAKFVMLFAAVINIFLSILLGMYFKLSGILLATGISRILTNVWYEPYILYKDYFKSNVLKYYLKKIIQIIYLVTISFIIYKLCSYIHFNNIYFQFIVKAIFVFFSSNIFLFVILFKSKEFRFILSRINIKK